jgi:hypothetical protein
VTYACCSACCTARAASCTQRCSRCYFGRCVLPHPGSYVHGSSVVLPQLHDAHGMLLGPRPTPLAECLRCQLLSLDGETLVGWLRAKLDAGPLVARFSSVASAIALITEHQELHAAACGTGTGAGGAGAGAGAGAGSGSGAGAGAGAGGGSSAGG